jgi:phosphoenolpyruvate carboxylase
MGTALAAFVEDRPTNLELLRGMYGSWPFFRHLLDNIQMAHVKASLPLAREYAGLAHDRAAARRIFATLRAEFERTADMITKITEIPYLLGNDSALALSLERRAPYIDAVNAIQVRLLDRVRSDDGDAWRYPLLLSINAIAAGMRNIG